MQFVRISQTTAKSWPGEFQLPVVLRAPGDADVPSKPKPCKRDAAANCLAAQFSAKGSNRCCAGRTAQG